MRVVFALILTLLAIFALTAVVLTRIGSTAGSSPPQPKFTPAAPVFAGRDACARCHEDQVALWRGSHHDLAMDVADEETVLGDFDDATLEHDGTMTTFLRRDGRFVVRTAGPDGAPAEYEVTHTFGVTPLQQYLVPFPGGRYQVLTVAWDTRHEDAGGQRWFDLYPDETIDHDDELHWTGLNQNWNFMCAECHSTNLEKGYDASADAYHTTWSEIDVSCEACHGPGSEHVRRADAGLAASGADSGLTIRLKDDDGGVWIFEPGSPTATRSVSRRSNLQVDACGRCHARRSVTRDDYVHGRPLLETHRPSLLVEPLYHADGQIREEVYVWGSFIQSRMHAAGVTCSDCHESHAATLRAPGNALCLQCHRPEVFDTPAHHFHAAGEPGSFCVDCHMPERTYMQVDPRRDHSLRVPRPDLSVRLGTPDACTMCHADRPASWAAAAVADWYGPERRAGPHYGEAIDAGRTGAPGAPERLARLAGDREHAGIVRATALDLLARYPGPAAIAAAAAAGDDADPLVRAAALTALRDVAPRDRLAVALPRLDDPVRGVRIEAARVLAGVPDDLLTADQRRSVAVGIEDYLAAERVNADRPESHLNAGVVLTDAGRHAEAEAEYRTALRLAPAFVEATVNLVDLYRVLGRDAEGERILRDAIARAPDAPVLEHVLGLLLVRAGRRDEALPALGRATALGPQIPRYAYVYAVALNETGRRAEAVAVIEEALRRHPGDGDLAGLRAELTR